MAETNENTGHCCPPGSLGYLESDPNQDGTKIDLGDGCEFYQTGDTSETAIIIFPDVWGWNSGRVRACADSFSKYGARCYIPKLQQPPFEGGTDGDGLPPEFAIPERLEEFMTWVKTITWDLCQQKVQKLIAYAKEQGATKFGLVGNCWGGWAAFKTSTMTNDFSAGVIFHPSCQLEGAHGGDVNELCNAVQCPFYFMPAKDDSPEMYGPEGSLTKILVEKFGEDTVKTKNFPDMTHGWVPRGDISDPNVKRDVQLAMTEAASYFSQNGLFQSSN